MSKFISQKYFLLLFITFVIIFMFFITWGFAHTASPIVNIPVYMEIISVMVGCFLTTLGTMIWSYQYRQLLVFLMSAEIMMISAAVIILAISQIFHSNEGFVGTFTILGIAACETTLILSIIRSRSISLTLENARTTM